MEKPNPFRIFNTLNKLIIKPNKKTMTRNEQQMYSDITSIRKSLEKIANALDNNVTQTTKDIPGFEGTLDALNNLYVPKDKYETDGTSVGNGKYEDKYTYDNDLIEYLDGVKNDSDYNIRVAASNFEDDYATKKDAILDYVELEFGSKGAKYTDIIKFAYYLGAYNAPKYNSTRDRGYYSCAFSYRMNGHLIQGGKDYLVKGINDEGKERYFTLSSVNYHTGYWKRIGR